MFRSTDSRPSETGRPEKTRKARRTRPECQALEGRALLATLADIPNVDVPARIGYQMPLIGGTANQTYTVQSDNPNIVATIAQGPYLTFHVTHTSSGANDPAFTGNITFQLFNDLTPDTVDHIARLVEQGFYTNKRFPRVASGFSDPPSPDGFIIQGGTITTSDTVNQPGFPFADEFVQQLAFTGNKQSTDTTSIYSVAGQLAMANSGSDTNGAQFFITTENPRFLDYKHTIFGQLVASDVVNGKTIVQLMTEVARNGETPINPIIIDTANLTNANPNGVVHIDATNAASGETATITVTATDPADGSTQTKTFDVNITDNATTERVFIDGTIQNQVVGLTTQTPVQGQSDVFAIPYVNPNGPTGQVAFRVAGSATSTGFTNVTNATATVDSNGIVTVKPNAGFTGVINLVVGVRNASAADAPSNYDLQNLTLTVTNTDAINLPPVAVTGTSTTVVGTPVAVQLLGNTANPEAQQTLTYEIVTPPAHGSLTGFDPATGKFTYVPNAGFQGEDTLQFRVKDSGDPGPSLTSQVATQYFVVDGGDTGAVRLISRVLVVTPPPSDNSVPNTIDVKLFNGKVQVFVNGELDAIQPKPEDLDRIVVFGSKKDDVITVSPDVEVPATLDGGHGGLNTIVAGGGSTVGHTWFGHNKITLGPAQDYVVGRAGGFRVLQPSDGDIAAAGKPRQMGSLHDRGKAPTFYYYKTLNGRLIRTARPIGSRQWLRLISPPDSTA